MAAVRGHRRPDQAAQDAALDARRSSRRARRLLRRAPQGRVPVAGEGAQPELAGRRLLVLHPGIRAWRRRRCCIVQFWSEPDHEDGVLFEVSLRGLNTARGPVRRHREAGTAARSRLRDQRQRGNFRKASRSRTHVRCAPRHARRWRLLCKVLGYDGRQELRFNLRLADATRSVAPRVRRHRAREFREAAARVGVCGGAADARGRRAGDPESHRSRAVCDRAARWHGERRSIQSATLRVFRKLEDPSQAPAWRMPSIASSACCRRSVDEDGDLVIESHLTAAWVA